MMEILNTYEFNIEKLSNHDKDVSKIYHKIENSKCGTVEGYALYKELRDELQGRRDCKNENQRILKAYDAIKSNNQIIDKLNQALGYARLQEEKQKNREVNK